MFEWLEQEIATVKMPRFHMVDGPADARLRKAIEEAPEVLVPDSYREFVLKFGNAKLYRDARNNSYTVGVFASPRVTHLDDGAPLYHLGFHDGANVYTKPTCSKDIIYEYEEEEDQVADSFEQWLAESCARAKNSYSSKEWSEILAGPRPFTEQEKEIVEARRMVRWKVLGIDSDGKFVIEVRNQGQRSLPVLTVGVRSKTRGWAGAKRLDIGDVKPGEKKVMHIPIYKESDKAQDLDIFPLRDPLPEDREYYWELRPAPPANAGQ